MAKARRKASRSVAEEAIQDMVEGAPDAMVAPVPIPRLRGIGPTCPACGSGMVVNGTVPRPASNHPFRRLRYYKCKDRRCGTTIKR